MWKTCVDDAFAYIPSSHHVVYIGWICTCEMEGPQPLTADQREEIRRMLCRFGGAMEPEPEKQVVASDDIQEFKLKEVGDIFQGADGGTTVDINDVTTGSYRYHIVRLSCALFRPLILDQITITPEEIIDLCKNELGVIMHRPTAALLTGAVEQSEPIVMFQVELKEPRHDTIETIRWMT